MRIAIASLGRFHLLDLARELAALGHTVAFYSYVPRHRALRFGLPPSAHRNLLPWLLPLLAVQRYGGPWLGRLLAGRWLLTAMDRLIASRLEPCDIFIGLSGLCIESARAARERYGATVFIERGSRHILSQQRILEVLRQQGCPVETVPPNNVARELAGYALADKMVVASRHVELSFIDEGFPVTRLFRNPYGVDLTMFPPTPAPAVESPPTLIYVGTWSYRKGVDILVNAWRSLEGVRLVHVGGLGDAPLHQGSGFIHHHSVPQWRLSELYAQAHLFVMASREEGLALVQAQALASGLPLVCTDRTGGADLQAMLVDPEWVKVVPTDDAKALAAGISALLPRALAQRGLRDCLGSAREKLSWAAYGRRYSQELTKIRGCE